MHQTYPDNVQLTLGRIETRIALHGAHVYSWRVDGEEQLFLSTKSGPINGPAAIRGGIPICWPVFGPPPANEPFSKLTKQHGFARTSVWSLGKIVDHKESVTACFELCSSSDLANLFPLDFKLLYTVSISVTPQPMLTTSLKVSNPSTSTNLPFQALLHTYLALPPTSSPIDVKITPLQGLSFVDKAAGGSNQIEDRSEVGFEAGEVDRVYSGVPDALEVVFGSGKAMSIKTKSLNNVTVWNPGPRKSDTMSDMQPEGWQRFVCVEPGQTTFIELAPGEEWTGSQTLIPRTMAKM